MKGYKIKAQAVKTFCCATFRCDKCPLRNKEDPYTKSLCIRENIYLAKNKELFSTIEMDLISRVGVEKYIKEARCDYRTERYTPQIIVEI